MVLSNLFHGMLKFERKFNEERERENEKVMCFVCYREEYTIRNCFKFFPCLKKKKGEQNHNHKQSKGFKHKKKASVMHVMWSADSDKSGAEDSGSDRGRNKYSTLP
jgi:hypothetical protein